MGGKFYSFYCGEKIRLGDLESLVPRFTSSHLDMSGGNASWSVATDFETQFLKRHKPSFFSYYVSVICNA